MKLAENPSKVNNIVTASFDQFKKLYAKRIQVRGILSLLYLAYAWHGFSI